MEVFNFYQTSGFLNYVSALANSRQLFRPLPQGPYLITVKPSNSGHPKQWTCLEQRAKRSVPNMTICDKLPLNSRHLSITDNFFQTRRCPLFRGFTVSLIWQTVLILSLSRLQRRGLSDFQFKYSLLTNERKNF